MTIYSTKRDYRKIYEQYHNITIPKDEFGRSYEIHHIDGNHYNNDITNLKLVTIQEHYDIHYEQKDYAACLAMSYRMSLSPDEAFDLASKLSTLSANQRVVENRHNFQDSDSARERQLKRVESKTHNWYNSDKSAQNNPRYDSTIYTFKNTITNEVVTTTRHDFFTRYNLNQAHLSQVINSRVKSIKNWVLVSPIKKASTNLSIDNTIYHFENIATHEQVSMTRYDFCKTFNLDRVGIYQLVKRKAKSCRGWRLVAQNAS